MDGWFRLGGLHVGGFVCWLVKTVHMNQHHRCCTFDSPGLPTIGGYPGESRGGEPMPSALYFLKSICMREIIHSSRVVMMCDEKKYNPQWGSLLACIVTQGRLRCTCRPCAIESITPMGYGNTVRFGAIECAIRWGMGTPCDLELSNVQYGGV